MSHRVLDPVANPVQSFELELLLLLKFLYSFNVSLTCSILFFHCRSVRRVTFLSQLCSSNST